MHNKVFIENIKGLKLAADIELPESHGVFPFVILLHGFKGYKDEETYTTLAKELVKVGIGSIRFDASGFAESEGTIENDYRFGNYVDDVEPVYSWLKQQEFCNISRIGVCGQSMGGMQAVVFTSNHAEIKGLCVVSSPEKMATTDLLAEELMGWKQRGYLEMESSRYDHTIRFPYEFIEEAMIWDMTKLINKVHCPSLFIWGDADVTVRPEQTKLLYDLANEPKDKIVIPGMDHFYKKDKNKLDKVNKHIVDFFTKILT